MDLTTALLILLGVLWLLGAVIVLQLVSQNGRILQRIAEIETRLRDPFASDPRQPPDPQYRLPVGTPAPDFALPELEGGIRRLSDYPGYPLLLVFMDPHSVHSRLLVSELNDRLAGRDAALYPWPIIITTGEPGQNSNLFAEFDPDFLILLQESREVADFYHVSSTPSACLVDRGGMISLSRVDGPESVLALANCTIEQLMSGDSPDLTNDAAQSTPLPEPEPRRTTRLRVNDLAPDFRLRQPGGGEIGLADFAGQRLLLVFVDPLCRPCIDVIRTLEHSNQRGNNTHATLIVSRRGSGSNQEMVKQLSVSIPVAIQHYWDLTDFYGAREVPAACLIGADGRIKWPLVTGATGIATLANSSEMI